MVGAGNLVGTFFSQMELVGNKDPVAISVYVGVILVVDGAATERDPSAGIGVPPHPRRASSDPAVPRAAVPLFSIITNSSGSYQSARSRTMPVASPSPSLPNPSRGASTPTTASDGVATSIASDSAPNVTVSHPCGFVNVVERSRPSPIDDDDDDEDDDDRPNVMPRYDDNDDGPPPPPPLPFLLRPKPPPIPNRGRSRGTARTCRG